MGFLLFILVNATLFIRPAEVFGVEELENLFLWLTLACLLVSLPEVVASVLGRSLDAQPITLCVMGILLCVPLAFLAHADLPEAYRASFAFFKTVVYYVLLASLVKTGPRLRTLVACVLVFCTILAVLSAVHMHGVIDMASTKAPGVRLEDYTGEGRADERLQGTGLFADPNEMCVMLAAMLPLAFYFSTGRKNAFGIIVGFFATAAFMYAIVLTRSRGGFLAVMGGLGVLSCVRFGWAKTALLGVLAAALLFMIGGGRQTEISLRDNTAQTRIELWNDWLMVFRESPFFGQGATLDKDDEDPGDLWDAVDHLAHNAYLQAFADLGFLGGVCFLSAFYLALWSIQRLGPKNVWVVDPETRRLQPFLLGSVVAYAVGMISLSLCYNVQTYFMLGLGAAFVRTSATYPPVPPLRLDATIMARCVFLGVLFLVGLYAFLQVMKVIGVL